MKKYLNVVICGLVMLAGFTSKQKDAVTNYYNIPETLSFNGFTFNLSWSSHPNHTFYNEEYIPADNTAATYKDMVLIDFIVTDLPVSTAVQAQVATINKRKQTDAVCNYQLLSNDKTGEYILDFVMSQTEGGNTSLVEWNGYHYVPYTDKAGHKGILLFGVSHRAYGNEVSIFLSSLQDYRNNSLKKLSVYEIPQIQIN